MNGYHILETSCYAKEACKNEQAGIVHSVYRRTINFTVGSQLLSLQAKDSPLSPISLITPLDGAQMAALGACVGDSVSVNENAVELHTAGRTEQFLLTDTPTVDLRLDTSARPDIPTLSARIRQVIVQASCPGFRELFLSGHDISDSDQFLTLQAADKRLRQASEALKKAGSFSSHEQTVVASSRCGQTVNASSCCEQISGASSGCAQISGASSGDESAADTLSSYGQAADALIGLIGLGLGLTPGGDDFLCGVLAGLTLAGYASHPFTALFKQRLGSSLSATNDISRAFLLCACDGQFSRAVNLLPALPEAGDIARAFYAIGHSSGVDTLCGILYILEHTQK